jgi:multiple sugar transport system permease protein
MFLILLAGLQACRRAFRGGARSTAPAPGAPFVDHTLPMLKPVIGHRHRAPHHRLLRHLRPGLRADPRRARRGDAAVSIFGYDTAFKFQQTGYAAALSSPSA